MNHTTDTPRTDAETYVWQNGEENPFVQKEFARQLERELAASQAEVERLQTLPASRHKAFLDLLARSEKAEANLRRAIAIADVLRSGGSRACRELHHSKKDQHEYGDVCPVEGRLEKAWDELDQLQATLNQDKK